MEADHPPKAELLRSARECESRGERCRVGGREPIGIDEAPLGDELGEFRVILGDLGDDNLIVGDQPLLDRAAETDLVGEWAELSLVVH